MNEGLTLRRKREAQKRSVTAHRERVIEKLQKRGFLKDLVSTLEQMEDRQWTEDIHTDLMSAKARLRSVETQLRAFGDVDL